METIKVTIHKDGTIEYSVAGVKGKSCADVTKFIDKLSTKTVADTKTNEYYMGSGNPQQNRLEQH